MAKCSHGLTSAECYVCASPKYGAPAAVPVTDAMVEALRDIEMAACYGTEEDPDAGPSMLRTIGEIARKALAEIDSAQTESKSRTPTAPAAPAADERRLRRMLCLAKHGHRAYMDDGEASDSSVDPIIDYLRDSLDEIEAKWRQRVNDTPAAPVVVEDDAQDAGTFWLIERGHNQGQSPPCWWAGSDSAGERWVWSVHDATRFVDKETATSTAHSRCINYFAITSHRFVDAAPEVPR